METRGILSEGFSRVWRYQRVLWWMFAANLAMASLGVRPGLAQFSKVLDHSLRARELVEVFNGSAFAELTARPDVQMGTVSRGAYGFTLIFFVFAMFLTGGILVAYRDTRKLKAREFFEACGGYFWRWVRMLIFLLIVLAPVMMMASGISRWFVDKSDDSPIEKLGFYVATGGLLLTLFLMMGIRLWFDMAQVYAVAEGEFAVRRCLARTFKMTWKNFGSLFGIYFTISLLWWVVLGLALWVWASVPARHFGWSMVLLEMVVLVGFGTRLWQRASETVWYERRPAPAMLAVPVEYVPEPVMVASPLPELPRGAEPEPQT